jgi:hypothetical protein
MIKYLLLSILAYTIYYQVIAPLFREEVQPRKNNYQEDDSIKHYKQETKKNSDKSNDDFAEYEEIK